MKSISTRAAPSRSVPALTVRVDLDPLIEAVGRHVKLSARQTRMLRGEFASLLQVDPARGDSQEAGGAERLEAAPADAVLTTQAAADLVGVSRPFLVARIEAGEIPLHLQVGNQRRVLKSDVLAWQQREQTRRRQALDRLGTELDSEIFPVRP